MKRLICLLLILLLTGCAGTAKVDLMPTADPENSALALYIYNGETITRQFLFETSDARKNALADFRHAKAEPCEVDVTTLQPPYYGLEVGSTDIGSEHGLWADGYFITDDGSAYKLDYDFEKLLKAYPWSHLDEFQTLTIMPCASRMAKTEAGWNVHFLTPAQEPMWPDQVGIELVEQDAEGITVRLVNNSEEDWGFGYAFHVDVLLDGQWYTIPAEQEMAFVEVLLMLPQNGDHKETYSLKPYGELPAGIYRLVTDGGLWVEFEVM